MKVEIAYLGAFDRHRGAADSQQLAASRNCGVYMSTLFKSVLVGLVVTEPCEEGKIC